MKYKHGFIGNSSSASYYIRRGANKTVDAGLEIESGSGTDTATYVSNGVVYDSWYAWHPKRTGKMNASVVIPVANGGISSGVGVKEVKFWAYGLVRSDDQARLVTDSTVSGDDLFTDSKVVFKVYSQYSIDTTASGFELGGSAWASEATVGSGISVETGDVTQTGFNLVANWDGSSLVIRAEFEQSSGSAITSCAIGIKDLEVIQDELIDVV